MVRAAECVRLVQDRFEYPRKVAGRGIDDLEDFGRGGLLFQGLGEFGRPLIKLRSALGKLALEIGDDLLRISYRTIRLRAHLRTSSDRLPSRIIPGPPRPTTLFSMIRGGRLLTVLPRGSLAVR